MCEVVSQRKSKGGVAKVWRYTLMPSVSIRLTRDLEKSQSVVVSVLLSWLEFCESGRECVDIMALRRALREQIFGITSITGAVSQLRPHGGLGERNCH